MRDKLLTYFNYLVSPFRSHKELSAVSTQSLSEKHPSLYESLSFSWAAVIIGNFFRLILITFFLSLILKIFSSELSFIKNFYNGGEAAPYYFFVFSLILDVIFFPVIQLFLIQFWDFIIKIHLKLHKKYSDLLEHELDFKTKAVLSVSLSANTFKIIPIVGPLASEIASLVLMYAGLRVQFSFSAAAAICVLMTPILLILAMLTTFMCVLLLFL